MNIRGITPIATTENAETRNRQAKPSNRRRRESYSQDFNPFTTANTAGRATLENAVEKCILPKLAAASDEKQLADIPSATDKPNSFTQWSDMTGAIPKSLEADDLEDFKELEDSTGFASLAVNLSTGSLPSLGQPNIPANGYRSFRGSPVKHSYTKYSPGSYRDVMGASPSYTNKSDSRPASRSESWGDTSPHPGTPRAAQAITTSRSASSTPSFLPSIASPQEEYNHLELEFTNVKAAISKFPNSLVHRYELAHIVKQLKQRLQNLQNKVFALPHSVENSQIIRSCKNKTLYLAQCEEEFNYMAIARKRVLTQIYNPTSGLESDLLLEPTNNKKGLEEKILLAETFLKISLLAEAAVESSERRTVTLLENETKRLNQASDKLLACLTTYKEVLEPIIGKQAYHNAIRDMQIPERREQSAQSLIGKIMPVRRDSQELATTFTTAIAVVAIFEEIQSVEKNKIATNKAIQDLLLSPKFQPQKDLLITDLICTYNNPISTITSILENPEISSDEVDYRLLNCAFHQFANREFESFERQLESHNGLAGIKGSGTSLSSLASPYFFA
ncbi:MAG: hypothetical protein K2Y01_05230 [Rhabdochlamydiaceae bacterium]|nr:hypothetical protein [Rhabdochlamydiaceae bacterium]